MTTVKKLSSDYLITNKGTGDVTISTNKLYVDGDLLVGGNSTAVTQTDTDITDNTITLNKGETGSGITLGTSGVAIDRGLAAGVAIRFNEDPEGDGSVPPSWEATEDGVLWKYILQGNTPGGLGHVIDDLAPELGGNLNITGHSLFNITSNVVFYANTVNGGGGSSGVYVNDLDGTDEQELITKRKALTFSILFG